MQGAHHDAPKYRRICLLFSSDLCNTVFHPGYLKNNWLCDRQANPIREKESRIGSFLDIGTFTDEVTEYLDFCRSIEGSTDGNDCLSHCPNELILYEAEV
jgi:hypothetical protein